MVPEEFLQQVETLPSKREDMLELDTVEKLLVAVPSLREAFHASGVKGCS